MKNHLPFALTTLCLGILSGCGGGSGDSTAATTSLSGTVADGYLQGAKVCLDINGNAVCDNGEPSATTDANGAYTLTGITAGQEALHPVVAEVPADAIDADTGTAVGKAYSLTAPAGKAAFVSPLSSLVQLAVLEGKTVDEAVAALKTDAGLAADPLKNYVAEADNTGNSAEARADFAYAHQAARVLVNSLQRNQALLGSVSAGERKDAMAVLLTVARQALISQGTAADPTKVVGVEDQNTLRALVAARKDKIASATRDVAIDFDLRNGAASIKCGDAISVTNTVYDHGTLVAATPVTTQDTSGAMTDTRFYVSNVMLLDANGNATPLYLTENAHQGKNVALLDFGYETGSPAACTTSYTTRVVGKVKPGAYTGISLTIGVPVRSHDLSAKLNHSNTTAPDTPFPLQDSALAWSWQSGRKFMKLEFKPDTPITRAGGTAAKWFVHIGSTGCAGDPTKGTETACTNPNRLSLNFSSFNPSTQKIVLDVAALFAGSDLTWDGGGAVGCMSGVTDPECPAIFKALGLGLTGANAGMTLTGSEVQTVFSVR